MANQTVSDQQVLNYINSLELSTIPITPEYISSEWELEFQNIKLSSESHTHYEYSKKPLHLITYKSNLPKTYNIQPINVYALYEERDQHNITELQISIMQILQNKIEQLYNSLPRTIKSNLASLEHINEPYLHPLYFWNNYTTLTKQQKINELTTLLMYTLYKN